MGLAKQVSSSHSSVTEESKADVICPEARGVKCIRNLFSTWHTSPPEAHFLVILTIDGFFGAESLPMTHYSISQLSKKFGLSRSTLLHYDAIGLLKPAMRTAANYRVYTDKDYERLQRICSLRSTGISLKHIQALIDSRNIAFSGILQKRIDHINDEIQNLRSQQHVILKFLGDEGLLKSTRVVTKEMWVGFLESAGLDEEGMHNWHIEFERSMPEAHQDFLESLGLNADEILHIRKWSKNSHE